jgi:hypothetical protein
MSEFVGKAEKAVLNFLLVFRAPSLASQLLQWIGCGRSGYRSAFAGSWFLQAKAH